jgi:DNA-binding SARP family transcriptional activator
VAAELWMDVTDDRASANLRTTLWKARQLGAPLVDGSAGLLALSPDAHTDIDAITGQVARLLDGSTELRPDDTDVRALNGELLPMWDDEWILFERERLRQLCIHGLEALARRLTALGRHAEAVDAGLSAVAADPLRESAQHVLIEAHLAEGNASEARKQFERYRLILADALGIRPGPGLERVVFGAA